MTVGKDKLMTAETTMELMLGFQQSQKPLIWLDYYKLNHTWQLTISTAWDVVVWGLLYVTDVSGFSLPPPAPQGWHSRLDSDTLYSRQRASWSHEPHGCSKWHVYEGKISCTFWLNWIMLLLAFTKIATREEGKMDPRRTLPKSGPQPFVWKHTQCKAPV